MNKYNNRKFEKDGLIFDSGKEYRRYAELSLLAKAGEISDLKTQVKFKLIPAQYEMTNGKSRCVERSCDYIADFTYLDKNGKLQVEDVKGCKKGAGYSVFVLKRKLMLFLHDIQIKEI